MIKVFEKVYLSFFFVLHSFVGVIPLYMLFILNMAVNNKTFKFERLIFQRDSNYNMCTYSTELFPLNGFKNLSIKFQIYLDGQLANGWHSLMVKVYDCNGDYDELSRFWIRNCKFIIYGINRKQLIVISLPNIIYEQNKNFGWVKLIKCKDFMLFYVQSKSN